MNDLSLVSRLVRPRSASRALEARRKRSSSAQPPLFRSIGTLERSRARGAHPSRARARSLTRDHARAFALHIAFDRVVPRRRRRVRRRRPRARCSHSDRYEAWRRRGGRYWRASTGKTRASLVIREWGRSVERWTSVRREVTLETQANGRRRGCRRRR